MASFVDLDLNKSLRSNIERRIKQVISSNNYILGPNLVSFEKKFAKFIGAKYAVGVGSGTDALRLALRSLGIGRGDKVLTVSFTSPFTVIAILQEGAIPVFADIDDATWTLSVEDAQKRIDKRTRAIIPVHIYGNPCNMTKILNFAKSNKIFVIEDACQAHAAKIGDRMVGTFGDASAFSFYPTKNLGALGDAGIITTNSAKIANFSRILRHGGQTERFWHKYQGINSRLDEIQAAILEVKLKELKQLTKTRQSLAGRYTGKLSGLPIKFQQTFPGAKHVYHLFVIRTSKRAKLKKYLENKSIPCDIYYPYGVHQQPAFRGFYDPKKSLPVTEMVTEETLALPIHPRLTLGEQDKIINSVKEFFKFETR